MGIPFWLMLLWGLTLINLILPDPIPFIDEAIPFLLGVGLLLRFLLRRNAYQNIYQQYQQYQKTQQQSQSGTGSYQTGSTGSGQSSSFFYSRFKNWGAGFQQPRGTTMDKDPYDILGIRRGASMDEIKRAYREKLKKFHPDVVESLKLGPEYKQMFEEKTQEIQKAYELLGGK